MLRFLVLFFAGWTANAYAWGSAEHSLITGAALEVLSPAILAWLGAEAGRWIKVYCNYPDFNWTRYGEIVKGAEEFGPGAVRFPDLRRDWAASYYCEFDEATGQGKWYCHGPRIGTDKNDSRDERTLMTVAQERFAEEAAQHFFKKAVAVLKQGYLRDGLRFAGVMSHFLEDSAPPPHTMIMEYLNPYHGLMEKIEDRQRVSIAGYKPVILGRTEAEAANAVDRLAHEIASFSNEKARSAYELLSKHNDQEKAQAIVVDCANRTAKALSDTIFTMYALIRDHLPQLPEAQPGLNLLRNPAFDEDAFGQNHPDFWVREWFDLSVPRLSHFVERYTPRTGRACVKLFETPPKGCGWRTPWAYAIPARPGQEYELNGWARPETASGKNYLAIMFYNAQMQMIRRCETESVSGSFSWKELHIAGAAPEGTTDVMAGCFSEDNRVAVLFDDISLVRTL